MRLPSNCPLFYVPGFVITYVVAEKIEKVKKNKNMKKKCQTNGAVRRPKVFFMRLSELYLKTSSTTCHTSISDLENCFFI